MFYKGLRMHTLAAHARTSDRSHILVTRSEGRVHYHNSGSQHQCSETAGSTLTTDREVGQSGAQRLLRCCCEVVAAVEGEAGEGGGGAARSEPPSTSASTNVTDEVLCEISKPHRPHSPLLLRLRQRHSSSEAGTAHRPAQPYDPWLEPSPPPPNATADIPHLSERRRDGVPAAERHLRPSHVNEGNSEV